MLGMLLVIEYHSYRLTHNAQEHITYKVELMPDITDSLALALEKEIISMEMVKHVDYVSREQAAEIFSEELGEDFIGFIGYNPLHPSLMVNLNEQLLPDGSSDAVDKFRQSVSVLDGVSGIAYQENVVDELREVFYKLSWFLIIFMALLVVVTAVLISSLIRIAIYSNRETIATMRMVGAKAGFIARPFRLRSLAYGALGGLIASVLTAFSIWILSRQFTLDIIAPRHWIWYAAIGFVVTLAGMLIAYLSTAITVHRHIVKH